MIAARLIGAARRGQRHSKAGDAAATGPTSPALSRRNTGRNRASGRRVSDPSDRESRVERGRDESLATAASPPRAWA